MNKKDQVTLIGICSGGSIKALTVLSYLDMLNYNSVFKIQTAISMQIGGYHDVNDNRLIKIAQEGGASHLLILDADMIFPRNSLELLLMAEKDIVGANYNMRDGSASVVKFEDENGKYIPKDPKDFPEELFECAAIGTGMMLIDMKVFDKLAKPYFHNWEGADGEQHTEDIVFCQDAKKAGFTVWCEPRIVMGHIGEYVY